MNLRRMGWTALMGLSLTAGQYARGDEPARLGLPGATPIPAATAVGSQKLADAIASQLEAAGTLKDYRVDVVVRSGVVELTGDVADEAQHDEVLRLVRGVPGVARVSDRLSVANTVIPVARRQEKNDDKPKLPQPPEVIPPPIDTTPPPKMPPADGTPPPLGGVGGGGAIPEPRPIFSAGNGGYAAVNAPNMPPHAWPTYAPHNNYSRVAYPLAYPYNSWPFIGPLYPYPKVPLGWRSVKLEWDDGYWWYSKVGCKHDWWKLRYW